MIKADRIWTGCNILTLDQHTPRSRAIATRKGKILAIGTTSEIKNLVGPKTKEHSLAGKLIMPGLIESHTHVLWGACRSLFDIYVGFEASLSELLDAVKMKCDQVGPDRVIFGGPWRPAMRAKMGSNPRKILDAISEHHTIVLHDASQHLMWCNSKALNLAGIVKGCNGIPGGVIEFDPATDEPNGILAETATAPVRALVKRSLVELASAIKEAMRYFNSMGFTGLKEPMAFEEELKTYYLADQRGELTVHMAAHIVHSSPLGGLPVPFDAMDELRKKYSHENLHLNFAKIFIDGVAPGFTASFLEPYMPESGYDVASHDPDRTLLIPRDKLNNMLIELDDRGYTVKMHAVGDNAIRAGLNAIEAARSANGMSRLRHEIAHCNFVSDKDLSRFKLLEAVAELSPKMWYPNPGTSIQISLLGDKRMQKNHRVKDLLKAGAEMIYGSDWPAAAPDANPWSGLSGMITRCNSDPSYPGVLAPHQAISLFDALPLFTTNGARALGMEGLTGKLEQGYWADFIVLDEDILKMPPEQIAFVKPKMTIWKDQIVYER